MDWQVWAVLAALLLAPFLIGFAAMRVARRYFPSGVVAKKPKTTYAVAVASWIVLLMSLSYWSLRYSLESAPPPVGQQALRFFPWPPPAPSAAVTIPISRLLPRTSVQSQRLMELHNSLMQALRQAGYFEASYYQVPRGFAAVTRLEAIQADGTPKPGSLRWDVESRPDRPFSLASYIEYLFTAPPGRYRVIVFIVTPEPFVSVEAPVTKDDATLWLRRGANTLPPELLSRQLELNTICTALIYEFWKEPQMQKALLRIPATLSADRHIVGAGLQRLLP